MALHPSGTRLNQIKLAVLALALNPILSAATFARIARTEIVELFLDSQLTALILHGDGSYALAILVHIQAVLNLNIAPANRLPFRDALPELCHISFSNYHIFLHIVSTSFSGYLTFMLSFEIINQPYLMLKKRIY